MCSSLYTATFHRIFIPCYLDLVQYRSDQYLIELLNFPVMWKACSSGRRLEYRSAYHGRKNRYWHPVRSSQLLTEFLHLMRETTLVRGDEVRCAKLIDIQTIPRLVGISILL